MQFYTVCNKNIKNHKKHILEFNKPLSGPNNKENFLCSTCQIKVNNKQEHYSSDLHRNNVSRDETSITFGLKEYIIHFDKFCNEQTVKALESKDEEIKDPFWSAAKHSLSKEDYQRLKEYANGERGRIRRFKKHNGINRYTRHSKLKRYSRASKCKQANCKETFR